ncbi:Sorting nexin-33 [Hypsibius exemplaris]|uniref:Sorting nexin n=1 Tax=Hypsibius exemplaris TaxID=2072580 RepID=A0A1W0WEP8_HYPEX|nr:Sorting nexin-33 [Hypsibius exemplaris]
MASKARVLYTFEAQPGSGELNINENEFVTSVFAFRWEGKNARGETGLFPATYVEDVQDVSSPPPVSAPIYPSIPGIAAHADLSAQSSWGVQAAAAPAATAPAAEAPGGDWDDEWDDDSDNDQEQEKPRGGAVAGAADKRTDTLTSASARSQQPQQYDSMMGGSQALATGNQASVKGNLNRFSVFVKSGTENYLLGKLKAHVPDGSYVVISETEWGPMWGTNGKAYTCQILSPKKESKMKGLKTFIAYQLVPSFNGVQVARRYKHFDWLHERLTEKFVLIPIPPLPDKQVTGRYEDDFIEHRMAQLKLWVNHLCSHPVLSQSDVWQHFLTCTDEKKWKVGKRAAEKDELVGGGFFLSTKAPSKGITADIDGEMMAFSNFVKGMDNGVRFVHTTAAENAKRHIGPFKREYEKLGEAFRTLGQAFDQDPIKYSSGLTEAIIKTGETYEGIGRLFADQPRYDTDPMLDTLHIYRGLLASFPEILDIQKRTAQKMKESEKLADAGKLSMTDLTQLRARSDVVSYSVMAEMNYFHQARSASFKSMMENYLEQQIKFYQTIVDNLKQSLSAYRDL